MCCDLNSFDAYMEMNCTQAHCQVHSRINVWHFCYANCCSAILSHTRNKWNWQNNNTRNGKPKYDSIFTFAIAVLFCFTDDVCGVWTIRSKLIVLSTNCLRFACYFRRCVQQVWWLFQRSCTWNMIVLGEHNGIQCPHWITLNAIDLH